MPPRVKVLKKDILSAALRMLQKQGSNALNARALAKFMGCSTQPIFSNFSTMDDLKMELLKAAHSRYKAYEQKELTLQRYPDYKASGMAYIRFACEEKELFKFLFMRDRSHETVEFMEEDFTDSVYFVSKYLGISYEEATTFHMEMWVYVHGIATMLATSYLELDYEEISEMLTDMFLGLKQRYESKKEDTKQ